MKVLVVCSVLAEEIELVMKQLNLSNRLFYLEVALHADLKKLENTLKTNLETLRANGEKTAVILGTKCHPYIEEIAAGFDSKIISSANCIELFLGEREMKRLDKEAKTFYITSGWFKNWRKIFAGWDSIDARMNLGYYDRLLLLDTGTGKFSDEEILEFFDFTQVPIDMYPITLEHFKEKILEILD